MMVTFDNFFDSLTQELIDMPDEQILEGVDVAKLQENARAMLDAAKQKATE